MSKQVSLREWLYVSKQACEYVHGNETEAVKMPQTWYYDHTVMRY
mgnify:CR=1 FL=1